MIYNIHHSTIYQYEENVSGSHHLARLLPQNYPSQQIISSVIHVSPQPDVISTHTDYFGNQTTYFSLSTPHKSLKIDSRSTLNVTAQANPTLDLSPSWESVRDTLLSSRKIEDIAAAEFTFVSPLCPIDSQLLAFAKKSFLPGKPILEACTDLTARIFKEFTFDTVASTVSTPVLETFAKRAGVCQDFAHLQIACLRSLGLPARYVSGYLRTDPPPGSPRMIGADASHAWISLYVPVFGWVDFDATNNVIPTENHIRFAHGRDYHDICPIRGTVYGGDRQILKIGVTVTPLEES